MQKASAALHNSSPCHTGAIGWRDGKVGMHLFIVPHTAAALSSLKCCSSAKCVAPVLMLMLVHAESGRKPMSSFKWRRAYAT